MTKKEHMTTKTDAELSKMLADTRVSLRTLRFESAGARPKDSTAPRKARKVVARILTETNARARAAVIATEK